MTPFVPRSRAKQLFPQLEATPDINRGEERFAAEVALAGLGNETIPGEAVARAVAILTILATG